MYSLTSGTYLFHLFSFFACVLLPLAHTYFIFFLFSHVFPHLWHIPISSFFFFRMCSLTSGTYPIHNFTLSRMYSLTSGTYLFHLFSLFACVLLPLAHTYFIFFLFSHVFPHLWHIPISSFFFFRMYSFAFGTYLIHNFTLSRMYSFAFGTYLIHNFTLSRMYSLTSGTYLFHLFSLFACIPLPLAHTYFIFFLFSHVFLCLWHIPNP
jgi:hypothetical protein